MEATDEDEKKPLTVVDNKSPNSTATSQQSAATLLLAAFLFCFVNFINFLNRYTTPPIIGRLKIAFQVSDTLLGLIPTLAELCYVAVSPLTGYLGDRFERRTVIAVSLLVSAISAIGSSLIPEPHFIALLVVRSFLGVAEAACTNIVPSLMGDLYVGRTRTIVLAIYQFVMPLGCGVGYFSTGLVADYFDDWRWGFRLTPVPMLLCALCFLTCFKEPLRGEAEGVVGVHQTTGYKEDLNYLSRIPSFIYTTLGIGGSSFASTALLYWSPDILNRRKALDSGIMNQNVAEVMLAFGLITVTGGLTGVVAGTVASKYLMKPILGPASDGFVAGVCCLVAAPACFIAVTSAKMLALSFSALWDTLIVCWIFLFVTIFGVSCIYVPYYEATLNVVIPTRRATARSIQTTFSHLIGDAASPYITGLVSDLIGRSLTASNSHLADFTSLQWSLYVTTIILAISGGQFLFASLYINEDAARAQEIPEEESHMGD